MSSSRHERYNKVLDFCKEILDEDAKQYRMTAVLELMYLLISIVLVIIAAFFSDIAGIITTAGMGLFSFAYRLESFKSAMENYFLFPLKMRAHFKKTRAIKEMCDSDDSECFDRVKRKIMDYLDALDTRAAEEQ